MDIFVHMAGLAFIPLMVCLIIPGIRDIFILIRNEVISRRFCGFKNVHFIPDTPFDHLPV